MGLTRKQLYRAYKKGANVNAGIAEMKKAMYNSDPAERGGFHTEGDLTNLTTLFRKYDKYAEPLNDTLVLLIVGITFVWFYFIILKACSRLLFGAEIMSIESAYEVIVFSTGITLLGYLYLGLKRKRKCSLDHPEKFPESKSSSRSAWVFTFILIIIEFVLNSIIERQAFGLFS